MSNLAGAELGGPHPVCCTPMAAEPIGQARSRQLAGVLHVLGDPVRLRLLDLIASHQGGHACVCDLTGQFAVTASTLSHHLKVLYDAGLVDRRREANWVRYQVASEVPGLLAALRGVSTPAARTPASVGRPHQ
jgi:ArsR family transcriptional regulator